MRVCVSAGFHTGGGGGGTLGFPPPPARISPPPQICYVIIAYTWSKTAPPSLPPSVPLQRMDRELYERARHVYTLYAQIEVDAANMIRADFEDLREQANLVGTTGGSGPCVCVHV